MGWNSWDCYGAAVTGERTASELDCGRKSEGTWMEYCMRYPVVRSQQQITRRCYASLLIRMDEYGRLIPAPNRFRFRMGWKSDLEIQRWKQEKSGSLVFTYEVFRVRRGSPEHTCVPNQLHGKRDYTSLLLSVHEHRHVRIERQPWQSKGDVRFSVDFIKVDDICVKGRCVIESSTNYSRWWTALWDATNRIEREIVLSLSPGPAIVYVYCKQVGVMWEFESF